VTARVRLDVGNRLIRVVCRAVREDVVDDHADDGEEEDDKSPENLVRDRTVRLEDFDCGPTRQHRDYNGSGGIVLLQAMMSRTSTMKPTMPPPVPACHGFADWTVRGAASTSRNMESCSRAARIRLNMAAVLFGVL
jgi:hypothetical protein